MVDERNCEYVSHFFVFLCDSVRFDFVRFESTHRFECDPNADFRFKNSKAAVRVHKEKVHIHHAFHLRCSAAVNEARLRAQEVCETFVGDEFVADHRPHTQPGNRSVQRIHVQRLTIDGSNR